MPSSSRIEHYWELIQFGFVRIIIAMGLGFIISSILNPHGTARLIEIILYNPYSLADDLRLDERWILLGSGAGLILFGVLLYTFMYLTEYRFKLILQKLNSSVNRELQRKEHSQLLELQFIITVSFLTAFTGSSAVVVTFGEEAP